MAADKGGVPGGGAARLHHIEGAAKAVDLALPISKPAGDAILAQPRQLPR